VFWNFTDLGESYRMELSNGALTHYPTSNDRDVDLSVSLVQPQLLQFIGTGQIEGIETTGNWDVLDQIVSLTDRPDPDFPVVTP
jgi:alkyl sulfatase BDS1-like metallo-beta-lactamase superfamily hydrolase